MLLNDKRTDGQSGPITELALGKVRQVKINRCNLDRISTSVISLLNIHLNISVYGQNTSTDKTIFAFKDS